MAVQNEAVAHAAIVAANTTTPATTGTMTLTMTGQRLFTIIPTGTCTFNASGGFAGQVIRMIITTSGTTSYVLTFGTNFKTSGTLSTGTTTAKVFCITFVCQNGTLWVEQSRTTAM
jgi:hypothetical protein